MVKVLPVIDDALAADLIEHLAVLLVDRDEALHVTQHIENVRLQRRLADLHEGRRQARTTAP